MKDIVASYMYLVESFENFLLLSISMKCRKEEYYSKFISIYFFFFLQFYGWHCKKIKFFIKGFFSKCNQICRKMQIWSNLPRKSLMENFIFTHCDLRSTFGHSQGTNLINLMIFVTSYFVSPKVHWHLWNKAGSWYMVKDISEMNEVRISRFKWKKPYKINLYFFEYTLCYYDTR